MSMTIDLFPYQKEAFDMFMDRGSLLLALDTGLGKTATAIGIAEDLLERRKTKAVLVVVPANLKYQWAKAIAKFTDIPCHTVKVKKQRITVPIPAYCMIIDGTPQQREKQYRAALENRPEYIIVGYDTVVSEYDLWIDSLEPTFAILDEASMIKNPGSERSQAIKECLRSMPFRLALTATPIENVPEDVYSIMQWVDPTVLGREDLFDKSYIQRKSDGTVMFYRNLDVLHERLSDAMFRRDRLHPDVKDFLPDVTHHVWEVDTSPEILEAYVGMCRDLVETYERSLARPKEFSLKDHYNGTEEDQKGAMGQVMAIHTSMEMLLDYPPMITSSAQKYEEDNGGSAYAAQLVSDGFEALAYTPKLDQVVEKVFKILTDDPDSKVILFSRYRETLSILDMDFQYHGFQCAQYHGEMTRSGKEAAVAAFLEDPNCRIFVSSHAGAYGTDLPVANWLINIDVAWGDGLGKQINGRHVRASSTFACVNVVDVVTLGTIEERKIAVRKFKSDVSSAAIDGKGRATVLRDIQALIDHAREVIEAWELSR